MGKSQQQGQNKVRKVTDLLTLVFVTIARDDSAQRLVRSVREFFPDMPILSADQNGPTDKMTAFYREQNVTMLWLPPDCGLSFARNRALEQIRTPYVLLADDDFVFTEFTELQQALDIMEVDRRIGFLGGRIVDIRTGNKGDRIRYVRRWEKFFSLMEEINAVISIPIDYLPLQSRTVDGHVIYMCDMTSNWGILRKAVFSEKLRWDEQIKINGEHEDFFLNLKLNSSWKVGYFPKLICDHEQSSHKDYSLLRKRLSGRKVFADKWGLTHHLELGVGLRHYGDYLAFEEVPVAHDQLNVIDHEPETVLAPTPLSKKKVGKHSLKSSSRPSDLTRLQNKLDLMINENEQLHALVTQKDKAKEAIFQSWSWRITAPFRSLATKILGFPEQQ